MTRVIMEKRGERYSVRAINHAKTEAGCAAISTLCYTLAGFLHNVDAVEIIEEQLEDGNVKIVFDTGPETEAETAFDMTCLGFLSLAKDYPEELEAGFVEYC